MKLGTGETLLFINSWPLLPNAIVFYMISINYHFTAHGSL